MGWGCSISCMHSKAIAKGRMRYTVCLMGDIKLLLYKFTTFKVLHNRCTIQLQNKCGLHNSFQSSCIIIQ